MSNFLYFNTSDELTICQLTGEAITIKKTDPKYYEILHYCQTNQEDKLEQLLKPTAALLKNMDKIQVTSEGLKLNGTVMQTKEREITGLLEVLMKSGLQGDDLTKVKKFFINVKKNPYIDSVTELYDYCKALDFAITDDGCFLAYKNVNSDYTSIHASADGSHIPHKVGTIVEETDIDTNRDNVCSKGLHFCTKSYLSSYPGGRTIIVKVNPADVVAIPTDYNFAKGRCTKYEIVSDFVDGLSLKQIAKQADKEEEKKVDLTCDRCYYWHRPASAHPCDYCTDHALFVWPDDVGCNHCRYSSFDDCKACFYCGHDLEHFIPDMETNPRYVKHDLHWDNIEIDPDDYDPEDFYGDDDDDSEDSESDAINCIDCSDLPTCIQECQRERDWIPNPQDEVPDIEEKVEKTYNIKNK